eukprot:4879292-Pyramimonas_sp.AAC.1
MSMKSCLAAIHACCQSAVASVPGTIHTEGLSRSSFKPYTNVTSSSCRCFCAGTLGVVLGYLAWVPFAPNFDYEEAPVWVYLGAAAAIFWSQTMDAVDGKQ